MDDVSRLLRRATLRLAIARFVRAAPIALTLAIAGLILARLAEQLLAASVDWTAAFWIAGAAALITSLAVAALTSRSRLAVARLIDRRGDLRESLSTALCLHERNDAWSRAAVEHAQHTAASVNLRAALPITPPGQWPASALATLVFAAVWFAVPQADLLGREQELRAQAEEERERLEAVAQVEEIDQELRDMLADLGERELSDDQDDDALSTPEPPSPDDIRRSAIRKLTAVQDRLEQLRSNPDGRSLDALRDAMRRLRQPGPGPLNEMVSALQRGDFQRAQEQLTELMNQIASGDLSEEQKQRLQEQLAQLAEQMQRLAQERENAERALKQAGLDPSLLNNPEALREAIKQAQGLSEAQKQQLLRQCEGVGAACQRMGSMSGALARAAQNLEDGAGMDGLMSVGDQLSELEMIQQELDALDAAQQFVWGKMNELSQCMGGGGGEMSPFQLWGERSAGLSPAEMMRDGAALPDAEVRRERAPSSATDGPIIGSMMVEGEQVRGESRAQFTQLVEAGDQAASDAIETMVAPREYHDALKHYFGRLKARAQPEDAPPDEPGGREDGS